MNTPEYSDAGFDLFGELALISAAFARNRIRYALIGGLAVSIHDEPRFTKDIDFLAVPKQLSKIIGALEGIEYAQCARPWTFSRTDLTLHRFMKIEGKGFLIVDILLAEGPRFVEILRRALRRKWRDGYLRVARKEDIVWLKRQRNSDQDRVDIRRLLGGKN